MTDQAGREDGEEIVFDRLDRRRFLAGAGGVSLGGGVLAVSVAAGRGSADGEDTPGGSDEPDDAASTAEDGADGDLPVLECGRPVEGELTEDSESTDPGGRHNKYRDVYRFEGVARERLSFHVSTEVIEEADPDHGIDAEPAYAGAPMALLLDDDGEVIAEGEETGYFGMDFFTTTLPYTGDYRLVVTSFTPNETFPYSFTLRCRDRVPVVEDQPEPIAIHCGETHETEFVEGDRDSPGGTYDVYAFDGTCGDVVTITALTDETGVLPQLFDPDGRQDPPVFEPDEFDPRGTAVHIDGGTQIPEYELPKTGMYTIWVKRIDWYDYQYDLTLECTPGR